MVLSAALEKKYRPAGFLTRSFALLGDVLIFGILYVFFSSAFVANTIQAYIVEYIGEYIRYDAYNAIRHIPVGAYFIAFYMIFQLGGRQAPLCLSYAGGKVVTYDGRKPDFKAIVIRNWPLIVLCMMPVMYKGRGVSHMIFLTLSFMATISLLSVGGKQKQGWHDRLAGCFVVKRRVAGDQYNPVAKSRGAAVPVFTNTTPGHADGINRLIYDAKNGPLISIWIVNLLLKMATVGIYTFWGKTRIRRYITGSFSLLNDRFEYTGTGGELFRGFLKALPIIVLIYLPFVIWEPKQNPAVHLMFLPILFLIYAGTYTALRYRFAHTTWRGIRGRITGSAIKYASLQMWQDGINILTLGIAIPYSDMNIQRYRADHMYFGSVKAKFTGKASRLMGVNIATLLLVIPTFGLSRIWYRAALAKYIYESTTFNSMHFKGRQTGANMFRLYAGNLLLLIITLGLGMPIIIQRNMQYLANNLVILGDITTADIHQSSESLAKSGEGIYGWLGDQDIGFL